MVVRGVGSLREYAQYLEAHPPEVRDLYRDLLINVTEFFRDAESFSVLYGRIGELLAKRKGVEPFRVWVPGCASGEEVYSLAICLFELTQGLNRRIPIQVFGTD